MAQTPSELMRASTTLLPPGWTRRRFSIGVVLAFALPAIVSTLQVYYTSLSDGGTASVSRIVSAQGTLWLVWGALSPLVVWIIRRSETVTQRVVPRLLLLTLGGLACAALHSAAMYGVHSVLEVWSPSGRALSLGGYFQGWLVINFILYVAIICAVFAILYHNRFRDREIAAARLAAELSQAQLRALRMQLNPHFLFNALNTIAMLVRDENGDAAVTMLAGLSDLLRHTLHDDAPHEVTLSAEIAFLERYLAIERTRFPDRLKVTFDVDAALHSALIPNLILQPAVENAVRHGIAPLAAGGAIVITARRSSRELILRVCDDGAGFANTAAISPGVGLTNTRKRLARLYGDAGRLSISPGEGRGTAVVIALPYHTVPVVLEGAE